MVGVDSAYTAKVVLGSFRIPPIKRELVCPAQYCELFDWHTCHDRAFSAAQGTITPPKLFQSFRQLNLKLDGTAMAGTSFDFTHFHARCLLTS